MTMKTMNKLGKFKMAEYPARTFAYVRNVGPYKGDTELFAKLFGQVSAWAAKKDLMSDPNLAAYTVYHDHPEAVLPAEQRISVGFTVPEGTQGEGDIQIMELATGKYLVGSFEIMPDEYGVAWGETMNYIATEGLEPGALMFESYKNEPEQHPEGKHVVDICVQLAS